MKTYYIVSCTYLKNLDDKSSKPVRTEYYTNELVDKDGTALQEEEKRFYNALIGAIGDSIEFGAKEDTHTDTIYQERIYVDAGHTTEIASFSVSENSMIRYLKDEINGSDHVIDGERCSTRTATKVGEWIDEWRWADVFRTRERLYRKRTGHFFIEETQQKYTNRPMWENPQYRWISTNEAQEWIKKHVPDVYEDLFGDVPENSGTTMISAMIRKDTKAKLDRLRSEFGKSLSDIIDESVSAYYESAHNK